MGALRELLAGDAVVVLDGGLATELEARGHDLSDDLWSARLLRDDPAAIEAVHLAYFRAGARCRDHRELPGELRGLRRRGHRREDATGCCAAA